MIICGLDLETTNLSFETGHITEIAWQIEEVGNPKPFSMQSMFIKPRIKDSEGNFVEEIPKDFISEEIYNLTKITTKHLEHGVMLPLMISFLYEELEKYKVDAIVAHNGAYFDRPMLLSVLKRDGYEALPADKMPRAVENIPWIDTKTDIIYPKDCFYTNLLYLGAYHGILNPFPHQALSDVQTMLAVARKYDLYEALERSKSPWVTLSALVSFHDKELAKARGYRWQKWDDSSKEYPKTWVKKVREMDLEKEPDAPFKVTVLS